MGEGGGGRCSGCAFARPEPAVWVDGEDVVASDGGRHRLRLALPGRANRANAAMAAVTASRAWYRPLDEAALGAMADTVTVDGRYRQAVVGASRARLLLAKNPAGWLEVFDMLAPPPGPVVVVINARIADGRDPSWLWDVPFEAPGRPGRVAASGERSRDLAVRLDYAEVEHRRIPDPIEAIGAVGPGPADVAATDTALRDRDARLGGRAGTVAGPGWGRSREAAASGLGLAASRRPGPSPGPGPGPGDPSGPVSVVSP